jgi:multicomponent Na+:H+ antiporter subunit A
LLGVGTEEAISAALVYLVAHACYKGALFLVAGAIDHETGTRDITMLSGLRRSMPLTAVAGAAAALSMAGVPLTIGFIAKDGAYEALLHSGQWWLVAAIVLASVLLGLAGLLAGVSPFQGKPSVTAHEPGWALYGPPLLLALMGVAIGLAPSLIGKSLWHGFTTALLLLMRSAA